MSRPSTSVTAAELADFLDLSIRRISDLAREGIVVRADGSNYKLRESVRGYCAHQRSRVVTSGLTGERERLVREQADRAALRNAQARGELLPAVAVEDTWATILKTVRTALLALPGRVQQTLGHLTAHDVSAIDREVRDCLAKLGDDGL